MGVKYCAGPFLSSIETTSQVVEKVKRRTLFWEHAHATDYVPKCGGGMGTMKFCKLDVHLKIYMDCAGVRFVVGWKRLSRKTCPNVQMWNARSPKR